MLDSPESSNVSSARPDERLGFGFEIFGLRLVNFKLVARDAANIVMLHNPGPREPPQPGAG